MKIYLISDNIDTLTGFRLTGSEGVVVHEKSEMKSAISNVLADSEIGILAVTGKIAVSFKKELDAVTEKQSLPIIVEIPDRHGMGADSNAITDYVRDAIGSKI